MIPFKSFGKHLKCNIQRLVYMNNCEFIYSIDYAYASAEINKPMPQPMVTQMIDVCMNA